MWEFAHKWLSLTEFCWLKQMLNAPGEEAGRLYVKIPWGKVRAVQELTRLGLQEIIRPPDDTTVRKLWTVSMADALGLSWLGMATNFPRIVDKKGVQGSDFENHLGLTKLEGHIFLSI